MFRYDLTLTTPATATPITLPEARHHLRVDQEMSADDEYITTLISAATEYVQVKQNRQLMLATYTMTMRGFRTLDGGRVYLPRSPLSTVTSVEYVDSDGDTQTWDDSLYRVKTDPVVGYLQPVFNGSYPATRGDTDSVTIIFVSGYANAATVPTTTKQAILLMVAHYYEQREPVIVGTILARVPESADALIRMDEVPNQHYENRGLQAWQPV